MAKQNETAAFKALDTYAATTQSARTVLVKDLKAAGYTTLEDVRPVAMRWASKKTGCPVITSEKFKKEVLDRSHPAFENAKTSLRRVLEAFEKPESSGKAEPVDPVEALLKRFAKLSAAQQRKFLKAVS